MKNSIFSIDVYKEGVMWAFDDARVGLKKEPFVAGADTLIDKLAGKKKKITLIFSDKPFPSATLQVERTSKPGKIVGTDYYCNQLDHTLWLCPALNLYYPKSPKRLYIEYKL